MRKFDLRLTIQSDVSEIKIYDIDMLIECDNEDIGYTPAILTADTHSLGDLLDGLKNYLLNEVLV